MSEPPANVFHVQLAGGDPFDLGMNGTLEQELADAEGAAAEWVAERAEAEREPPRLNLRPFVFGDEAALPRRQHVYGTHYTRKYISATVGPGGIGKTSLTLVEAVAMASGKPLLGVDVPEPLTVAVLNLEDPLEETWRRLYAIRRHYGLSQRDIGERLIVHSGRDEPVILARQTGREVAIATPMALELREQIHEFAIDVLIVDPFVASHAVTENDNGAISFVAREWADIANNGNCAIDLSHHVRKGGIQNPSIEDARGAGALIDAARSARRLVGMSAEEAVNAGIDPAEAWRYCREGDGKQNLAPPDRSRSWRKLVSVDLANGDSVGVQTPWTWPDAFTDVTPRDLEAVKLALESAPEPARLDPQADLWWGNIIANTLGLDPEDKVAKAKVKTVAKTWLESGEFETYETLTSKREQKKHVRAASK